MAFSLLQSTTVYPYSDPTITVSAGSLLVLFMSNQSLNIGTNPTVVDNNGGTWTVKNGYGNTLGTFCQGWIAYSYNHPAGSTTITVSGAIWTTGSPDDGISLHEYSGADNLSDPFDGINGGFSSLANPSSGNVTTTGANDLLVGFLADETTTASPSSYGIFAKVEESTGHYHTTAQDLNVGVNTYSFTVTRVAGTDTVVIIAAFRGATGLTQDQEWPAIAQMSASGGMVGLSYK